MNKFLRIVLIIAVWATITWIFREKLLPLPKPDAGPPPHFRDESGGGASAQHRPAELAAPAQDTPAAADPVDTGSDDLQQVKGIGPVYEHRLAAAGITSFDQLLEADAAEVADTIDASESQVLEWIGQARQLRD